MRRHYPALFARALPVLAAAVPALPIGLTPAQALAQISIGINFGGPDAGVGIRIGYAPPPMPVYVQPPLPAPDYIWVPGHWAWSDYVDDYYWVPGYWELPPQPGLLWTPAWWGWENGAFGYHEGYWGHEVGWYGGIDYGYGYHGHGWEGGYWQNGHIAYNGAIINVTNVHITNVYYHPPSVRENGPRVSYNGGAGGIAARPSPEEIRATQAPHIAPTPAQRQRVQQAASNPHAAASQMTTGWHPPAVHRVDASGAPIPRAAALAKGGATAGAPANYHPTGAPANNHPAGAPVHMGEPAVAPARVAPPAGGARQAVPAHGPSAPNAYHPAPPPAAPARPVPAPRAAPQPAPAAHPAPAPHAAPPPPRPAAPKPSEPPRDHHEKPDHS